MMAVYEFKDVAALADPRDNVAILRRDLKEGDVLQRGGGDITLESDGYVGHRISVTNIEPGEKLLSWNRISGEAVIPIGPGVPIYNEKTRVELLGRDRAYVVPDVANFKDDRDPVPRAEDAGLSRQVEYGGSKTFWGFNRPDRRSVGTRNNVFLIPTTASSVDFVRYLAREMRSKKVDYANIDDVVPITHTETSWNERSVRALAGLTVHPNASATLLVDEPGSSITTNQILNTIGGDASTMADLKVGKFRREGGWIDSLREAGRIVEGWLPDVNRNPRTRRDVRYLNFALQCGGSDAFSGVYGNPLMGALVKILIGYGGSANIAETDELKGAEWHMIEKVRSQEVAKQFLDMLLRDQTIAEGCHGALGSNPSPGNVVGGLYSIIIKSLGAAMKKDPAVRLDYVIEYAEQMLEPGFYMMDSPGNDAESYTGQEAAGCNIGGFVTGRGSVVGSGITPVIKIASNSIRADLVEGKIDVDAEGMVTEHESVDAAAQVLFEDMIAIASGEKRVSAETHKMSNNRSQLWVHAKQDKRVHLVWPKYKAFGRQTPTGEPLTLQSRYTSDNHSYLGLGKGIDRVGLIIGTSLCSGEDAVNIAEILTEEWIGKEHGISSWRGIRHELGCGASSGQEDLLSKTFMAYGKHPNVGLSVYLEHGCEVTHNDAYRNLLRNLGVDLDGIIWASLQENGGPTKALAYIRDEVGKKLPTLEVYTPSKQPLSALRVGLSAKGAIPDDQIELFADITQRLGNQGITLVVPSSAKFLNHPSYLKVFTGDLNPTLSYGDVPQEAGFHIMEMATSEAKEVNTGLATACHLTINYILGSSISSHPVVPALQVTGDPYTVEHFGSDLDVVGDVADQDSFSVQVLREVIDVASRRKVPIIHGWGIQEVQPLIEANQISR